MTCVHKIRWSVKRPEDCRFRLSVSHYKDRIVAPDEYSGATVVTPSDSEQVLATKDKLVRSDITVNPAPTEALATNENGTFVPSSGNVGFSSVTVDVEPALESLSVTENGLYLPDVGVDGFDRVSVDVPIPDFQTEEKAVNANGVYYPSAGVDGISKVTVDVPATGYDKGTLIYEGDFSAVTGTFAITELPNGQAFAFDKIEVELSDAGQGYNSGWRQYWRSDLPQTGNQTYMFNPSGTPGTIPGATSLKVKTVIMVEDSEYISLLTTSYDEDVPTLTKAASQRIAHGGYDKITGYGWWSWNCPAGSHIKITGYNRTQETT